MKKEKNANQSENSAATLCDRRGEKKDEPNVVSGERKDGEGEEALFKMDEGSEKEKE